MRALVRVPVGKHKRKARPLPPSGAPREAPEAALSRWTARVEVSGFSGPLPHPEILKGYEEILPGLAERIVRQFERQAQHRQQLEGAVVAGNLRYAAIGQWMAFGLAAIGFVLGLGLVYAGHSPEGLGVFFTQLATLVGLFLNRQRQQRKELTDKRQPFRAGGGVAPA